MLSHANSTCFLSIKSVRLREKGLLWPSKTKGKKYGRKFCCCTKCDTKKSETSGAEFRLSKTQKIDVPCENLKMRLVGGIEVEIQ